MQLRKYIMSGLLLCSSVSYTSDVATIFSSGNVQLDQVERAKYKEYLQQGQEFEATVHEAQHFRQLMMGKFMVIMLTVSGQMSLDDLETKEDVCEYIKLVCQVIQKDHGFTGFTKSFVECCEHKLCDFVVAHYDKLRSLQVEGGVSLQKLLELFSSYLPYGIHPFKVYVDWSVWHREFLLNQLEQNGCLTFEDLAYTGYKMIEMCHLPEVTANVCRDIIQAFVDGMNRLPEEVVAEMWDKTIVNLQNSEEKNILMAMQNVINERDKIIALGDSVADTQLDEYAVLLEDMLTMKLARDNQVLAENYSLAEKLFFQN